MAQTFIAKEREFGDLILRKRKENKMSLDKLAEETEREVTPSYINRLEKSQMRNPSFEVVCLLTRALNIELEDVFEAFGHEDLIQGYEKRDEQNINPILVLKTEAFPVLKGQSEASLQIVEELISTAVNYSKNKTEPFAVMNNMMFLLEELKKNK